jgi:hypothetical protein
MEFRQFDRNTFEATRAKWRSEAEEYDCFPDEVDRKLQWIEEALSGASPHTAQQAVIPYGVFAPGESIAAATCELVLSHRGSLTGKWLKLLKVTMSPEIEVLTEEEDQAAIELTVNAYRAATLGAYNSRLEHAADTLKLFGRNARLQEFQTLLMQSIQRDPQHRPIIASQQGRWLVLKSATTTEECL